MSRNIIDNHHMRRNFTFKESLLQMKKWKATSLEMLVEDHGFYVFMLYGQYNTVEKQGYGGYSLDTIRQGSDMKRQPSSLGLNAIDGLAQFLELSTNQVQEMRQAFYDKASFKIEIDKPLFVLTNYTIECLMNDKGELFSIERQFCLDVDDIMFNEHFLERSKRGFQNRKTFYAGEESEFKEGLQILENRTNILKESATLERSIKLPEKLGKETHKI